MTGFVVQGHLENLHMREVAWESNRESERGPGVKEDTSQKTCLGEAEEHKIGTEEDYKLKVGAYLLSVSLPYLRTKGICLCCPKKPNHTEVKLFFCDVWKEGLECYPICCPLQ